MREVCRHRHEHAHTPIYMLMAVFGDLFQRISPVLIVIFDQNVTTVISVSPDVVHEVSWSTKPFQFPPNAVGSDKHNKPTRDRVDPDQCSQSTRAKRDV